MNITIDKALTLEDLRIAECWFKENANRIRNVEGADQRLADMWQARADRTHALINQIQADGKVNDNGEGDSDKVQRA